MTLGVKSKGGGTPQPIHANLSTEFVNMTLMNQNSKTPLHGKQVNFFSQRYNAPEIWEMHVTNQVYIFCKLIRNCQQVCQQN